VSLAGGQSGKLLKLSDLAKKCLSEWRNYNQILTSIMTGRFMPGQREFSQFTFNALSYLGPTLEVKNLMARYISLAYGDPSEPREIPCDFALRAGVSKDEAAARIREAAEKTEEARQRFRGAIFGNREGDGSVEQIQKNKGARSSWMKWRQ
jgi:hypothetical protein